ncbi:interleukin-15 receptor subunit alpha isoform X2 [Tamandua tetradactyla]|uniref:interleukin-15 receptor subunit alpha isoform X2 n=1 Tax=Tamandua tetradactyla TaxID=48850 RepID=UPI0040547D60
MTLPRLPRGRVDARAALLLLLLLRPLAMQGITCPTPTSVEHADIRVKSYNLNSRERYTCNLGFKRKAGTSSLTECVLNTTTNAAHWTSPNLKCIRDPSLSHQMPVSPSTVVPAGRTPEPESPTPSGKEPEAFSPKSNSTVGTETALAPGSRLTPSKPPAGAHPYNSSAVTVAVSTSTIFVILLAGICVAFVWARYNKARRNVSQAVRGSPR